MSQIIIEPLKKAVSRLEEALNMPVDDIVRDATAQRFEYCYELSFTLIKRFLKEIYQDESDVFNEILKKAAKYGLVSNIEEWKSFRMARNYTSHNYSESGAEYSYSQAAKFLDEVKKTLVKMQEIDTK